jgi:hypothetical protein
VVLQVVENKEEQAGGIHCAQGGLRPPAENPCFQLLTFQRDAAALLKSVDSGGIRRKSAATKSTTVGHDRIALPKADREGSAHASRGGAAARTAIARTPCTPVPGSGASRLHQAGRRPGRLPQQRHISHPVPSRRPVPPVIRRLDRRRLSYCPISRGTCDRLSPVILIKKQRRSPCWPGSASDSLAASKFGPSRRKYPRVLRRGNWPLGWPPAKPGSAPGSGS